MGSLIGSLLGLNASTSSSSDRVTLDDIESQFRSLGAEAKSTIQASSMNVIGAAALGVIGLIGASYLHGRRRGRGRASVLEIRRV